MRQGPGRSSPAATGRSSRSSPSSPARPATSRSRKTRRRNDSHRLEQAARRAVHADADPLRRRTSTPARTPACVACYEAATGKEVYKERIGGEQLHGLAGRGRRPALLHLRAGRGPRREGRAGVRAAGRQRRWTTTSWPRRRSPTARCSCGASTSCSHWAERRTGKSNGDGGHISLNRNQRRRLRLKQFSKTEHSAEVCH